MKQVTWLHITDLHCGISEEKWLWPTVREQFYQDIDQMVKQSGKWDLVIFSGDLTQCGQQKEFELLDIHLEELWNRFKRLGMNPHIFVVPGNHDLQRPPESDPYLKLLRDNYWRDQSIRDEFWNNVDSGYRRIATSAFSNFQTWWQGLTLPKLDAKLGAIPGDSSAVLEKDGIRLGLVGLNTAILQLAAGQYEGRLDIHYKQATEVCNLDLPTWCSLNTANILVTHHPPSWLHSDANEMYRQHIYTPNRFMAHLCGHLHETQATEVGEGGAPPRRVFQTRSLYGLEYFTKGTKRIKRNHGYAIGQVQIDENRVTVLRLWPRRDKIGSSGTLKLVRDDDLDLDEFSGAATWTITSKNESQLGGTIVLDTSLPRDNAEPGSGDLEAEDLIDKPPDQATAETKLNGVPRWNLRPAPQHNKVRLEAQQQLRSELDRIGICWVAADWGLGKEGFLSSVLLSEDRHFSDLFRVNCDEAQSCDQLLEEAGSQFGLPFQQFSLFASALPSPCLVFDNIPLLRSQVDEEFASRLEEVALANHDLCKRLVIILVSRSAPSGSQLPWIELRPLDEAECRRYVHAHPDGGQNLVGLPELDQLFYRSEGLPMHLDRILKELQTVSIGELSIVEPAEQTELVLSEPIPIGLIQAVSSLRNSADRLTKRSWRLLKVLSVISRGETFQAIRRFDGPDPFHIQNVDQLRDLGLLETVPIETASAHFQVADPAIQSAAGSSKLLVIPRQVRDYIRLFFDDGERDQIAKTALEIYFGSDWRDSPSVPRVERAIRLDPYGVGPGNPHIIATSVMRQALNANDDLDFDRAFRLVELYLSTLRTQDRFRDIVNACQELLQLTEAAGKREETAKISAVYAQSIRMLGKSEECVLFAERALQYATDDFGKHWFARVWLSLALAHESLGDFEQAIAAANEIESRVEKDSSLADHAKAIKIMAEVEGSLDKPKTVRALVDLEGQSRRRGNEVVANNIALSLVKHTDDIRKRAMFRDRVLLSKQDTFNRIKAMLDKAEDLLERRESYKISPSDRRFLQQAYTYLYSQRLSMFDRCHRILWRLSYQHDQVPVLLRIFRYSSFLWRIFGKAKQETECLAELQLLVPDPSRQPSTEELTYFSSRLRTSGEIS